MDKEITKMQKEVVSSDTILNWLKAQVESKRVIAREEWLDVAFRLNLLRIDEAQLYNKMRQAVAKKKLEILKGQDKKNVSLAEAEIESLDENLFMRDQEDKIYSIDEFIRIAKKSSDINY